MQTTQNLVGTILTCYPVTGTVICSKRGRILTAYTYSPRYEWLVQDKNSYPLPPFVPGVFNIKPYYAYRHEFKAEDDILKGSYCRFDGVYFEQEWAGKVAGLETLYNACPKTILRPAGMLNEAVLAAYSKLSKSAVDTLAEFGEFKETLRTLRHPLKELREYLAKKGPGRFVTLADATRYYRRFPKKFTRDVKQTGTAAANTWLEWRYGIRPILMTIQDLLELASKQLEKASTKIRSKRRRLESKSCRTTSPLISGIENTIVLEETTRVEAIVYYRRHADQQLLDLLGLRVERIPDTIWELTRLSFVVDWVFSIGNWIKALIPPNSIEVLGATQSWKYECRGEIKVRYKTIQGSKWSNWSKPNYYTVDEFHREVLTGPPSPVFQGVANIDFQKTLDIAALIWTGITRSLKH